MTKMLLIPVLALYMIGFGLALWINTQLPAAPALMWVRAAAWPYWFCGGLKGVPQRMD